MPYKKGKEKKENLKIDKRKGKKRKEKKRKERKRKKERKKGEIFYKQASLARAVPLPTTPLTWQRASAASDNDWVSDWLRKKVPLNFLKIGSDEVQDK